MTVPLSGFDIANFPLDILYGTGVVFVGDEAIGVTEGAPKVTFNRTFDNITFDGKHSPIKGIDRVVHGEPVIAFTMKELGNATTGGQVAILEAGGTSATSGDTPPVTAITPPVSGALLASGGYLTDFRVLWERGACGSGSYFAVYFACALVQKWDISGQNAKEAQISVEVAGRIDVATQDINEAAYVLEYRTDLPS